MGSSAAIALATTHFDRAGETGVEFIRFGEIVTVQDGWAVIDAESGDHVRCPVTKLYPAPAELRVVSEITGLEHPSYIAGEELIRDYHSAKCPLIIRWLTRAQAVRACKQITAKTLHTKSRRKRSAKL